MNQIQVFLSCSFDKEDTEVVRYVEAICSALGLATQNVNIGSALSPPAQAKKQIESCDGLVACLTRRESNGHGQWYAPQAVREEIALALGLGKPIHLLVETGVVTDGFLNGYGVHLPFDRETIHAAASVQKLVSSLRSFRSELERTAGRGGYSDSFISEETRFLVALECDKEAVWHSTIRKRLRFHAELTHPLTSNVWPSVEVKVPSEAPLASWALRLSSGSRPFTAHPKVIVLSPNRVGLEVGIEPTPLATDSFEYERSCHSRYLNPCTFDNLLHPTSPGIEINGRLFRAYDGAVVSEQTRMLYVEFRFPEWYVEEDSLAAFAAAHVRDFDWLVSNELQRVKVSIVKIGGVLRVELEVKDPLMNHMYGVAWQPPQDLSHSKEQQL